MINSKISSCFFSLNRVSFKVENWKLDRMFIQIKCLKFTSNLWCYLILIKRFSIDRKIDQFNKFNLHNRFQCFSLPNHSLSHYIRITFYILSHHFLSNTSRRGSYDGINYTRFKFEIKRRIWKSRLALLHS